MGAKNASLLSQNRRPDDSPVPEGIAAALTEALADREALAARGEAGRAEAARYSWSASATATRDVYRQALRR